MLQRRLAVAVRAAICVALAWLALGRLPQTDSSDVAIHTIAISATIVESLHEGDFQNLTVQEQSNGRRYTTFTRLPQLSPGDQVEIHGTVHPFEGARNPGGFSPASYAHLRGIYAEINDPAIRLVAPVQINNPRFWPARFRIWGRKCIAATFPGDEAAVLTGMLWGDHRNLTYEDTLAFSATGTSHLLVTAGLHLGFFAALVLGALRLLTIERSLAALITISVTVCACVVSDAHIPSMRAAVMIITALSAQILGTTARSFSIIAYAALVTLCIDPVSLGDASWYLSFSCVVAIVNFATPLEEMLVSKRIPSIIAKACAVTSTAQIGTWALIAAQFHQISLVAPLANLLAVPLALGALALSPLFFIGHTLRCTAIIVGAAVPLHLTLTSVLTVVRYCAHLPFATITVRAPALWSLIVYEFALFCSCWLRSQQAPTHLVTIALYIRTRVSERCKDAIVSFAFDIQTRKRSATALLLAASVCVYASTFATTHDLRITMLDVGQGDGIVIETPNDHTILIDTGGRLELHAQNLRQSPAEVAAARVLLPFLAYEGVTHIDLLLLTHPHGDHVGGAAPVLRSLQVAAFLDSGQQYLGTAYQDALRTAASAHVPRLIAKRGQLVAFDDGVTLRILAPIQPLLSGGRNDVNENSIVAMLSYQGLRVLFTGDAGAQTEMRLLAQGDDLAADILKVGHHGSAYASSAAFLRAVHPRLALISVGQHNLFHHPAPPTLGRLRAIGAQIFRTDRCGAVTIETRQVSTMLPCS